MGLGVRQKGEWLNGLLSWIMRVAASFLLVCVALTAQDTEKFTVRSDLVFLPTRVQTKKGDTVYGLKPDQFIVEDNSVRQTMTIDEDPESSGLSLVVVVQCSRAAEDEMKASLVIFGH